MKKLVLSLMLLMPGLVSAECGSLSCSNVYVDLLYVRANGDVSIQTSGTETNLNCTPGSGVYLRLHKSDASSDFIYSALLSAQMADKPVKIRIVEGSPDCKISYITMAR